MKTQIAFHIYTFHWNWLFSILNVKLKSRRVLVRSQWRFRLLHMREETTAFVSPPRRKSEPPWCSEPPTLLYLLHLVRQRCGSKKGQAKQTEEPARRVKHVNRQCKCVRFFSWRIPACETGGGRGVDRMKVRKLRFWLVPLVCEECRQGDIVKR